MCVPHIILITVRFLSCNDAFLVKTGSCARYINMQCSMQKYLTTLKIDHANLVGIKSKSLNFFGLMPDVSPCSSSS